MVQNEDAIFKLSLEEAGVVTTCDITTLYQEHGKDTEDTTTQGLFSAFREYPEECQLLVKSEQFREMIHELVECFWAGPVHFEVNNVPGELKVMHITMFIVLCNNAFLVLVPCYLGLIVIVFCNAIRCVHS